MPAPNVYPVDLFERLWTVDRIERLGIARYFESEITDSLEYVYRWFSTFNAYLIAISWFKYYYAVEEFKL